MRGGSAAVPMISAVQEGQAVQIHVTPNANETAKVECFCIFKEAAPIFFTLMCKINVSSVKEVTGSEETTPQEQVNTKKRMNKTRNISPNQYQHFFVTGATLFYSAPY